MSEPVHQVETALQPSPGAAETTPGRTRHHVCPVWVGYLLASPLRRLVENPEAWLAPHVRPGMTALDLGCAMGFFSLPLARMVGPSGRVVCVDLQEAMLRRLRRRARRAGLEGVVETRACCADSLGLEDLDGRADLALAFHVVHEVPDPRRFLAETLAALRAGGTLLLAEPPRHVAETDRAAILALAENVGFRRTSEPLPTSRTPVVLTRPSPLYTSG